jgi:hypothetical protein
MRAERSAHGDACCIPASSDKDPTNPRSVTWTETGGLALLPLPPTTMLHCSMYCCIAL